MNRYAFILLDFTSGCQSQTPVNKTISLILFPIWQRRATLRTLQGLIVVCATVFTLDRGRHKFGLFVSGKVLLRDGREEGRDIVWFTQGNIPSAPS